MKYICNLSGWFKNTFILSKEKWAHVLILSALGIFTVLSLELFSNYKVGEGFVNKYFDEVIRKAATESISNFRTRSQSVANNSVFYVDIDHETFTMWGKPLVTPRNQLSDLIQRVFEKGAKVVVVDVSVDAPTEEKHDDKFLKTLKNIGMNKDHRHVILTRRFNINTEFQGKVDLVVKKSKNIFYATPTFYMSGTDNTVRYWTPVVQSGSDKYLHTSLLASILYSNNDSDIKDKLFTNSLILKYKLNSKYRIYFSDFPPGTISDFNEGNLFTNRIKHNELDYVDLNNSIVVIGNSSEMLGDIHATPIGPMPGMYLIGNAIKTINNGKASGTDFSVFLFVANLGILISVSYLITIITNNLIQFIAGACILVVLFDFLSLIYIRYDILIIAPVGIMAIIMYEGMSDLEKILFKYGRLKKWFKKGEEIL